MGKKRGVEKKVVWPGKKGGEAWKKKNWGGIDVQPAYVKRPEGKNKSGIYIRIGDWAGRERNP